VEQGAPLEISAALSDGGNTNSIHFNRTIDDPVLSELFASKDFRAGMSHAINRQEIIDIVHFGQGTPAQVAPLEGSPLYNEQLATQYLEYDVEMANEYLDRVIPERDAEGYRLGPDGERVSIVMAVSNDLSYGTTWVQIAELLIGYWDEVGIEVLLNSMPDAQFIERKEQNEIELTLYTGEGGAGITPILDPRYYTPMEYFGLFGNGWFAWRTAAANAVEVEPSEEIQSFRAEYEEVLITAGQDAQFEQMAEVLQIAADQFWVLGISRPAPGYQPYHERLGNQPDVWIAGWIEGVQKLKYPEQWYIIE
jgi:peptide/nickel transport system substrate-binding protein